MGGEVPQCLERNSDSVSTAPLPLPDVASGRPRPLSETHFLFCQVGVMDLLRGCSKGHGAREAETWHLVTEQLAFAESWVPTQDGRLHGSAR